MKQALVESIQKNCHIADARYAGDYTLCVYLLKMRELFRWEQRLGFKTMLTSDDVGDWLIAREGLWDELEEHAFSSIEWQAQHYDAFEGSQALNRQLNEHGLVYSAGYGQRCRPHFFLAELDTKQVVTVDGVTFTVYQSGKELARDMAAPPAMTQGHHIFIRKESLRRMLWEKVEEWRWNPVDNALGRAVKCYPFDDDVESALDSMVSAELNGVIDHEVGEVLANQLLTDEWNEMLNTLPRSTAEIMLRAVCDHLADALYTLPRLLQNMQQSPMLTKSSMHFYFGNLTAMRKKLAPALFASYEHWHQSGELTAFHDIMPQLQEHWQQLAEKSLALFAEKGEQAAIDIEVLIDSHPLGSLNTGSSSL